MDSLRLDGDCSPLLQLGRLDYDGMAKRWLAYGLRQGSEAGSRGWPAGTSEIRNHYCLKRSIAVRTFSDWNDPPPGFFEMDIVAHCGKSVAGSGESPGGSDKLPVGKLRMHRVPSRWHC